MIMPLRSTPLLDGTLQNLFYPPAKGEYTYFKRANEKSFNDKNGSLVKAAWAADAAMLAYATYSVLPVGGVPPPQPAEKMQDAEFDSFLANAGLKDPKRIGDWTEGASGTKAYFASNDDFAILAFRGTEADVPSDMVTDGNLLLVPEDDYIAGKPASAPGIGLLASVKHMLSLHSSVHLGFQRALDAVWKLTEEEQEKPDKPNTVLELVNDYLRTHPGKEICFTGHSLGGALAILAFSRFEDKNISVYTFGCPRVGDAAFRDRTLSYPGRGIYRFVNRDDFVTHVPIAIPVALPYCQTPRECWRFGVNGELDQVDDDSSQGDLGKLKEALASLHASVAGTHLGATQDLTSIKAPDSMVDHSPARYCFRLWDCV